MSYSTAYASKDLPLIHWEKYGSKLPGNPKTMQFVTEVFIDVKEHGEGYVLSKKYLKQKYREVCGK